MMKKPIEGKDEAEQQRLHDKVLKTVGTNELPRSKLKLPGIEKCSTWQSKIARYRNPRFFSEQAPGNQAHRD
jgi:hypothetical protein